MTGWSTTPLDGVLLDIDDTLVDTHAAFASALLVVARQYLPHLDETAKSQLVVRWRADPNGHYRRFTNGEVDYLTQRMDRANDLHAEFGGPQMDRDEYVAWNTMFDEALAVAWTPHPDAGQFLAGLADAGLPVGTVTNATVRYQVRKLAICGLLDLPVLVGVDTLGVGKPDPRVFAEGCRLLGTDPARTLYVGDELYIDAVGARTAGLVAVWLDRPGIRRVPLRDAEIFEAGVVVAHTLADLPAIL
ncbi:MAG: HAD family hydrolase [Micrococcales bacterium]|nr:HAD family hydrolase [Micrococcales bacterium]MCL2668593.1 HAD family hydrolase [Micrococcales bacterium]